MSADYCVIYLGAEAKRCDHGVRCKALDTARSYLRKLKRRGLTAWIETTAGEFVPVPGTLRKPGERL